MPNHTVKEGEHLSGIAARYGFKNPDTIWNDPKNAKLKQLRKDPHVLLAGDELFIPDKRAQQLVAPAGARHKFQVSRKKLKLRLAILDFRGKPVVSKDVKLECEGVAIEGTDGDGFIELEIPATAKTATLTVDGDVTEVQIGHLDPIGEIAGVRARLANMGYFVPREEAEEEEADEEEQGDGEGASDDDDASEADGGKSDESATEGGTEEEIDEDLRLAIHDFQADNDLDVTGALDDATRSALEKVHGS